MAEREIITERKSSSNGSDYYTAQNLIYFLFGLLIALLTFRFIFRLLGANPGSGFVDFVYSLTNPFVAPFYGIFGGDLVTEGAVTTAVLDSATLVAIAVYALIGWGVGRLVAAASGRPTVE
ncbi:MAG TPA: YggT family protein [Candidatus Dormibacteraeota bacterium]|nr:YggT family protein [Candidatus Dormibacteraeota bacterium]